MTLQIVATRMHLSPEFGFTYQAIKQDGFHIDRKVEMLTISDTPVGTEKSIGLGLIGFADALSELCPDLILVLGDRFEILSAVSAALALRIPVVHLHGGEATGGVIDEAIRHSITKMFHLHFVAAEEYRRRWRLQAKSVITCDPLRESIASALGRLYSDEFQADLDRVESPYGEGGASANIVSIVKSISLDGLLKKPFYYATSSCG